MLLLNEICDAITQFLTSGIFIIIMSLSTASDTIRCRDVLLQKVAHAYKFLTEFLPPFLRKLPNHAFFKTWKFKRSAFVALIFLTSIVLYKIEAERQKKPPREAKSYRKSSIKSIHNNNHKKVKKSISQLSLQKAYESHT